MKSFDPSKPLPPTPVSDDEERVNSVDRNLMTRLEQKKNKPLPKLPQKPQQQQQQSIDHQNRRKHLQPQNGPKPQTPPKSEQISVSVSALKTRLEKNLSMTKNTIDTPPSSLPFKPSPPQTVAQKPQKEPAFKVENITKTSDQNKSLPHGYALFDFVADNADELSVKAGDIIILEKRVDPKWILASNARTQQRGIIPLEFIDVKINLKEQKINNFLYKSVSKFDYDSVEPGDLPLKTGQVVFVTKTINNEWLQGETEDGRRGIFPATFLEDAMPKAEDTTETDQQNGTTSDNGLYATALYQYSSESDQDLCFRAGDRLSIIQEIDENWLFGECQGSQGLLPRCYVQFDNWQAKRVVALNQYRSDNSSDLWFDAGDTIQVTVDDGTSWLQGHLVLDLNSRSRKPPPEGTFPRSFVRLDS